MKAGMVLMVVALAVGATAGCASTQEESAYVAPRIAPVSIVDDGEYVSRVEQLAKRRGVGVVWVNPPQKRLEQVASTP